MHQFSKKLMKLLMGIVVALGVTFTSGVITKADTAEDAANALYAQQLALAAQYQAILAEQYQAAILAQYQAALTAQSAMQQVQSNAVDQAYLLNAVQAMQAAQYQAMLQKQGLEYQGHLMTEYTDAQKQAMKAFLGYTGL